MGRELKRVPIGFDWPLDKVWGGFVNPFYKQCTPCPDCDGSGASPEYKRLQDKWYGNAPFDPAERGSVPWLPTDKPVRDFAERNVIHSPGFYGPVEGALRRESERLANLFNRGWNHHLNQQDVDALVKAGRLMDFTHQWTKKDGWKKKVPPYKPTAKEVNEWSLMAFGHDSINCWVVCRAEAKRLRLKTTCARCKGEGSLWPSKKVKKQADDWKGEQPPKGDAYQIWETVSEGSPISPAMESAEELAEWMEAHPWGGDTGTSKEQWLKFILGPGWAMSLVATSEGVQSGVQFMANHPPTPAHD